MSTHFNTTQIINMPISRRKPVFPKPKFEGWKFAKFSAGLQEFQVVGCIASLFLIGSVGSHFPPTYAAMITCSIASIGSAVFLLCDVFNINETEPDEWIFWESVYVASFTFIFLLNSVTMLYSAIRWGNSAWWFSTVVCAMVFVSFVLYLVHVIRKQKAKLRVPVEDQRKVKVIRFNQRS